MNESIVVPVNLLWRQREEHCIPMLDKLFEWQMFHLLTEPWQSVWHYHKYWMFDWDVEDVVRFRFVEGEYPLLWSNPHRITKNANDLVLTRIDPFQSLSHYRCVQKWNAPLSTRKWSLFLRHVRNRFNLTRGRVSIKLDEALSLSNLTFTGTFSVRSSCSVPAVCLQLLIPMHGTSSACLRFLYR